MAGNNLGYAIGYCGGRPLVAKLGGAEKVGKAEAFSRKWGGPGVFLSRWLDGPLGPWINLTSGLSAYPWSRFLPLDVAGELLWVLIYVSLGRRFSDQVQSIANLLRNLTWVVLGLGVTIILGWKLLTKTPTRQSIV